MDLRMPDSERVADLPAGYPAYLGYADGDVPTAAELAARFPAARLVILTVTGRTLQADGCDVEPGNLTAAAGANWCVMRLTASHGTRPVIYASVIGEPGYGMGDVLAELKRHNISRDEVRLLSAHYDKALGAHICGPATCGLIGTPMDGTQFTDEWRTETGAVIDMSVLSADFFGALVPVQTETERIVQELGIVRQGDIGAAVKTVQSLCNARTPVPELSIDGMFGPRTLATVKALQAESGVDSDGIVGPQTWPVLLGVALCPARPPTAAP